MEIPIKFSIGYRLTGNCIRVKGSALMIFRNLWQIRIDWSTAPFTDPLPTEPVFPSLSPVFKGLSILGTGIPGPDIKDSSVYR